MATVRRDDSMLLIGGQNNDDKFSNNVIEYDFKTGLSKVLMEIKTGGLCSSAAVYSGNILVVIGRPSVDCFSFSTNSWKKLPSITNARIGACAAMFWHLNNSYINGQKYKTMHKEQYMEQYLRITALLECIIGIYKHEFTNKKQEI